VCTIETLTACTMKADQVALVVLTLQHTANAAGAWTHGHSV